MGSTIILSKISANRPPDCLENAFVVSWTVGGDTDQGDIIHRGEEEYAQER